MKRFAIYILRLLLGILLIMTMLDYAYTKIYETSAPRTKFQLFRSLKGQHLDYAFLGSSRVDNDINPLIIEKETGKKGINLGFQASKLKDIYTILQLFKKYDITVDKLYVQVDYIYNIDGRSHMLAYELIPFIRDNAVTKEHFSEESDALYYVPFYRYCLNDYKIGIREITLNLLRKKTNTVKKMGYNPVFGHEGNTTYALPETIPQRNNTFEHIREYCKNNNINVVYFCSPFNSTVKNMDYIDKLKHRIPELKDYSRLIKNDSLFVNTSHLNDAGATYFSRFLCTEFGLK